MFDSRAVDISFKVNDKIFTVKENIPPETTLNDYIRDYVAAKGTKYMCREGGCGACIVAVKRYNLTTKKSELFAVNSCLVPVYVCYGWSIITIEGIGNKANGFHKIQSTLAGFSGTQCGYCSPGMVMNMFSLLNGQENVTMEQVEDSFGGNICRCTGYRPILDAFKSLASDATEQLKKTCVDIEDMMKEIKMCPKSNQKCIGSCTEAQQRDQRRESFGTLLSDDCFTLNLPNNARWIRAKDLSDIYKVFESMTPQTEYMLVAGYTSNGVYRNPPKDLYIDINNVDELHKYSLADDKLTIGANVSLNDVKMLFTQIANQQPNSFAYLQKLADHINLVAHVPVKNLGTLAGNISIKYEHHEFPSDLFLILEAAGAVLTIGHVSGSVDEYPPLSYLALDMNKRVIINARFPALDNSFVFTSYKIMKRAQNTHADVNAAFLFQLDKKNKFKVLQRPNITFGGINPSFVHPKRTEEYLNGKQLLDVTTLKKACQILQSELQPNIDPVDGSPEYRRSLAVNLMYKMVLSVAQEAVSPRYKSGGTLLQRPLSSGKQDYGLDKSMWPVGKPIPKLEAFIQCSGEAEYVNDIPTQQNELYAAFVLCRAGPAKLESIDTSAIMNIPGVVKFLSAKHIPGENTFVKAGEVEPEVLFADKDVQYAGQPVGIVVATSQNLANEAAELVVVNVSNKKKPVLDLKKLVDSGDQSRIYKHAEKAATKRNTDIKYKLNGTFFIGGQYHYTMETQSCLCVPVEDGIDVYPATQWPTSIQYNVSAVLAIPLNSVNVSVKRCGGGYGAKLGRSALTANACAVAAYNCKRAVRMVMKMETNMEVVGKRFPMYAKYEVAVNGSAKIQYLDISTYSENGAFINDDAARAIIGLSTSLYDVSTWSFECYAVRTNVSPNTYARAPGSCEGIALIEYIMEHIAHVSQQDVVDVRLANLTSQNTQVIPQMLADLKQQSDLDSRKKAVAAYNKDNRWKKRGLGIAFMDYPHANIMKFHVLISVFSADGTVAISHGGIEIGQGVNTKVAQACAYKLGIDLTMIKIKPTTSFTSPNDGATGGSVTSDGVTMAALQACDILLARLQPLKDKNPNITWKDLINKADSQNVDLCVESMYSPTGSPSLYSIHGLAVTEVEIDLLTGQHQILRVDILEDVGKSISPDVDIGQVEGAFVMGLGYWLVERLVYSEESGTLLTNRSWNYTPPVAKDIPIDFRVYFRRNSSNLDGVLRSKAVGEPPLCLSISVVFAIQHALASARKDVKTKDEWFDAKLPYLPENVLLSSLTSIQEFGL